MMSGIFIKIISKIFSEEPEVLTSWDSIKDAVYG